MSDSTRPHARQAQDLTEQREAIAQKFARWARGNVDGVTAIPWLMLYSRTKTTLPHSCVYEPTLAIILRGRKHVIIGKEQLVYDESRFLLSAIEVPVMSYVVEASESRPFMALIFKLDLAKVRQMGRGIGTGAVTPKLLDDCSRLLDLLEAPEDIPVLSDLILREILYRLLRSEQGGRLWHLAMSGSQSNRILAVIDWLRHHYAEPLRVDDLASMAAMSSSSMHHYFRAITSMSPLQYQKQLRIQEARRLMLVEGLDAASAALRVGYDSPSQFSREYNRQFGQPPKRDIKQLRDATQRLDSEPEGALYA